MTKTTVLEDFQKEREEMDEDDTRLKTIEELDAIKKKERIFDFFWSPEEQRTILGLLKGRKMKKELKEHLKEKETKK
jgi:hypothetical protein